MVTVDAVSTVLRPRPTGHAERPRVHSACVHLPARPSAAAQLPVALEPDLRPVLVRAAAVGAFWLQVSVVVRICA